MWSIISDVLPHFHPIITFVWIEKTVLGVFYRYSHRMMKKQEKQRNLLFMQFLWNYAFFSFLSLTVKVWQRQSSRGNMRSHSEAAGKRWERGNFLTANARPWVWVLQCDVRVGAGVFLIIHFTKPAFKYPGGSWNRSLHLCRDSSFASIVTLSQTQKLDKCLKVQRAWTYCIYTSSLTSLYGLHIHPCVFLHQSFTPVLACFVSQIVKFRPRFCTPPSSSPLVSSATLFLSPPSFTPSRKTCDGSLRCSESGSKVKDTEEVIGLDTCCKSQRARVLIMGLYFYPFLTISHTISKVTHVEEHTSAKMCIRAYLEI